MYEGRNSSQDSLKGLPDLAVIDYSDYRAELSAGHGAEKFKKVSTGITHIKLPGPK